MKLFKHVYELKILHFYYRVFAKEWTQERLSKMFKTTENLGKCLKIFGASVNDVVNFVMAMHEIQGNHYHFSIDMIEDMTVRVEFFSAKKVYSFAVKVSYAQGFKQAKYHGTQLEPLISNGFMIGHEAFKKINMSTPSGWNYLKELVELLDQYVIESEKLKNANQ